MTETDAILRGILFGLGAAIPIGPVNVEIARRALSRGWVHGVALGLGAVSVDVVYACLAVAGLGGSGLGESPYVFWPLAVAGTALLAFLGVSCLRAARSALAGGFTAATTDTTPPPPLHRVYATGFAMTATNPMTLAVWFGGFTSTALAQGVGEGLLKYLALGVFAGTFVWVLTFSGLISVLARWKRPWWMAVADVIGGLVLLAFAALTAAVCIRRLLA